MESEHKSLYNCLTGHGYGGWVHDMLFKLALHEGDFDSACYLVTVEDVDPMLYDGKFIKELIASNDSDRIKTILAKCCSDDVLIEIIHAGNYEMLKFVLPDDAYTSSLLRHCYYSDILRVHCDIVVPILLEKSPARHHAKLIQYAIEDDEKNFVKYLLECSHIKISLKQLQKIGSRETIRETDIYKLAIDTFRNKTNT